MTDGKAPLIGHLQELRKRLIISLIAILVGFIICFNFSEDLFLLLTLPMKKDLVVKLSYPFVSFIPKNVSQTSLVFLAPAEAFWMHFKISLISGLFLAIPVMLYQLWKFISPALLPVERKYAIPFVIISAVLFFSGILFCFTIVLPFALRFLLTYKTSSLIPMISVGNYIDFCLIFILGFGAIFELPVVILFLARMGVVSPKTLAKNRKYAILIAFVISAILTPTPDAFNQLLMAVPIIFLYEGGILVSRLFIRRKVNDKGKES